MKLPILLLLISTIGKGPFKTSGYFEVKYVVDTLFDSSKTTPVRTFRLNFSPQFYIYGMPVSFHFTIGSAKERLKEWLNQFAMKFSPQRLIPAIPGIPNFLLSFPGITIGDAFPVFSPFTISGIRVRGLTIKYTPGIFYFSYTGGAISPAYRTDSLNAQYKRAIRGISVGIGKKSATHFHLTFMHSWDDTLSINPPFTYFQPDTNVVESTLSVAPMENFILGTDFGFTYKGRMNIRGEVAVSELTSDVTAPLVHDDRIPDWAEKKFKPRVSTHVDYAARGTASFKTGATQVKLRATMIGPGFVSFGLYSTRKDLLKYTIETRTRIWHNRLGLGVSYHEEHDNLLQTKEVTTELKTTHVDVSFISYSLPYFTLYVNNSEQKSISENTTLLVGANIGYSKYLGSTSITSQLTISYQSSNLPDTLHNSSKFYTLSLSETFSFPFPLSFTATLGHSNFETVMGKQSQQNAGLNLSYTAGKFKPGAGVNYTNGAGVRSISGNFNLYVSLPYKFNFSFQTTLTKISSTSVSKELYATMRISKRW